MSRDEIEAAYFTLLRAREEVDAIHRYDEYLHAEQQRLRRFQREGQALADSVPERMRRSLRTADDRLDKEIDDRLALLTDERAHLPERERAAHAFVEECERAHAALREGS
jgi:hypothetical protein